MKYKYTYQENSCISCIHQSLGGGLMGERTQLPGGRAAHQALT